MNDLFTEDHKRDSVTVTFHRNLKLKDKDSVKNRLSFIRDILGARTLVLDFTSCEHVDSSNSAFLKLFVDNLVKNGKVINVIGVDNTGTKFEKMFNSML